MNKIDIMREIISLLSDDDNSSPSSNSITGLMIGEYVLVRSHNEGINAGEVITADDKCVALRNARRLWYHKPAKKTESWYEGVANHGLSEDSKISGIVQTKVIVEPYSMTLCTEVARKSIQKAIPNAQV